ncbi:MAG TPA: protein kinase [Holophagaceae bacterium]|nr:protein kinase [Holophagaceae bacterium]
MPLAPGTLLGPYEIHSLLGSGGMGEVYRARDPRLNRVVAVKILSESWRKDSTFLARFEREAKVLASLNHPNIVSLFEFGEMDGRTYAVMELLEGRTLRQALASGPLPLRRATEIGAEVARGLSAAHRAGIIHRDLKPENIFLADQGAVKLLDFGIAKRVIKQTIDAGKDEAEFHPTSTNAGVFLGTVGYMAPEQLQEDGIVDGRSDLFALGCVLYEMVAGTKAFASETPMGTLHAILTQDPDFEQTLFPSSLRDILRHCLAKPPGQRFQDAQDLAYALEALRQPLTGAVQALPHRRRRGWILGLAGLSAILVAGLAYREWTLRTQLPAFTPLSPYDGQVYSARFDGSGHALFALRQGDSPPQVWLSGVPAASLETFQGLVPLAREADGSWLLLQGTRRLEGGRESLEGTLLRGGGPAERLKTVADGVTGADVSAGGLIAVTRRVDGHYRLEAPVGTIRAESNGWMDSPRISPSGRWIAYVDHPLSAPGGALTLVDLKDGSVRNLPGAWSDLHGLAWSAQDEIWFTASKSGEPNALYAENAQGRIRPLLSGPESMVIEDVSANGEALLLEEHARLAILARAPTGDPGALESADPALLGLSFNGAWMAFASPGNAATAEIRLAHLGQATQSAIGHADLAAPSPDGSKVALAARDGSGWRLTLWNRAGSKELPRLEFSLLKQVAWSPSGDALLLGGASGAGGYRVWRMKLDGSDLTPLCPEGVSPEQPFLISPDGKSLIVQSGPLLTRFNLANPKALPFSIPGISPGEHLIGWGKDPDHLLVIGPRLPALVAAIDLRSGSRQPAFPVAFYGYPGALIDTALAAQSGEAFAVGCRETRSRLFLVKGLR